MTNSNWHYPRKEFADKVYNLLAKGPIQGVSIFGLRRTGKTQFLTHDLAPLAEDKGHRVVYASLWQTLESPLAILLYEFDRALRAGSFLDRVKSVAGGIAPKFKIRTPDGTSEMEIDLAKLKGKAPEQHLLLLDQYCERLASDRKPAFLFFDEFQELEKWDNARTVVAALRTSLDKRTDGLAAVFSGSSQIGLQRVFSERDAPFFRFALPIDLPPLTDEFVDHQLTAFRSVSKKTIERAKALEAFHLFNSNPMFFQRWLMTIAIHPNMSDSDAVDAVQAEFALEFGFNRIWLELNQNQRIMARMLASRVEQVYGRNGVDFIRDLTNENPPSKSALQAAVNRLARLGIVDQWGNVWRFADPLFENWVLGRPASDF